MRKAYQYLFYKLYSYMLRTPNRRNAFDGAIALLSLIVLFLFMDVFVIYVKVVSDVKFITDNTLLVIWLIIALFIYLFNTIYFKKRIAQIKEEHDMESNIQKWIGRIIVLIVGIGSVGSLIAIGLLLNNL